MHRSGTSLIAQWLRKCGLHIGNYLVGADEGNKDGHFEDWDFVRIHQHALKHYGFPITGFINEHIEITDPYHLEKIRVNIEFKNRLNNQWGWKDPRTCLFLNNYRAVLSNAKYLIIFRSYSSVVNSLIKRDIMYKQVSYFKNADWFRKVLWKLRKKSFEHNSYNSFADKYLKVWIHYNEELLKHIQMLDKQGYLLINHSMLFNYAPDIFNIITGQWNFDLTYHDFDSIYKPQLMSEKEDVLQYIKDSGLIKKANTLMDTLEQYTFKKGRII